jgi:glycosyltransferase involved in cell wall biosynthesis
MKADTRVALQQAIIPDYRMGLFLLLREHWGGRFEIYAGEADFGWSPVSTCRAWDHFTKVRNCYLLGDKLLWQRDSFWKLVCSDVAILNANMRILSNWGILFLRRILGRPTILWGHVVGQSRVAGKFRGFFLRLSKGCIVYTNSQADLVAERYPWLPVWVAANSCVFASDCVPVVVRGQVPNSFLYVGRLVAEKKVILLLEGFVEARKNGLISPETRLVFVGEGAERGVLEERAVVAGVEGIVDFAGHVSDVALLQEFYGRAICSVSPGYVGLSATQSFSFGVPMLIAKDEFHSPEIEACQDGFNAKFFASDDPLGLAKALTGFFNEKEKWLKERSKISEWTRCHYSFDVMRDAFVQAVTEVSE